MSSSPSSGLLFSNAFIAYSEICSLIATKTSQSRSRHLWYGTEEPAIFVLYYNDIDNTKQKMPCKILDSNQDNLWSFMH